MKNSRPMSFFFKIKLAASSLLFFIGANLAAQEPGPTRTVIKSPFDSAATATNIPQNIDSLAIDSSSAKRRNFFTKNYPNPRKAALFSILVPGSGQAYNKKYWKVPLAWGICAAPIYYMLQNTKDRNVWRRNYKAAVDGDPGTVVEPEYERFDKATLKQGRDFYQKNLEISYLATAGAYLVVAADAFVDAHLKSFDVSDDLSLKIAPRILPSPGIGATFGLGLCFSVR